MTPYRFDVTYLSGGTGDNLRVSCAGHEADSSWRLARRLVEDDAPDGPIEAGREGKVDWTFPSLHQFAVGAVSSGELDRSPERLHPALRAAVVALGVLRAAKRAQAVLLALAVSAGLCGALPAGAAPPKPGTEDYEIMAPHGDWIRRLQREGVLCCTMADGRPVEARTRGDRWQVRWRPGQLEGAPTDWTDVPPDVVMHMPNPIGVPIAFWLAGRLRCFVPAGGI